MTKIEKILKELKELLSKKKKKAWCSIFQGFKEGIKMVIAKFYKKGKNHNYCGSKLYN